MVEATPAPETVRKSFANFLKCFHSDDLRSIVLSSDQALHYPLVVHFAELLNFDPKLAHRLFSQPTDLLPLFDEAAHKSQQEVFRGLKDLKDGVSVKGHIHVRIDVSGSPLECPETFPSIGRLRVKHRGILLTLKGTVIRSGAVKMIEGEREYQCKKCKHRFKVHPEIETGNRINLPSSCPSWGSKRCEGISFQFIEDSIICHDYQEIKIQESAQLLGVGSIPRSLPVVLMDDLVDLVKAGDDVIITGVLTAKWSSDLKDVRCDLDPILVANFVRRTNELKSDIEIPEAIIKKFQQFWSHYRSAPLKGRNVILQGICPQIFGLFTVKLAVALTLIGGVQHVDSSGTKIRGEPHMLLVGDPGTGKSQFLKFAAKLSNRSVITTGLGSTSAGLTVTAVRDSGEWMLEAGALVLADGGLCCIDEFDSMRGHDRATIHEAMEQQTISVAKAGLVTTLSTRTTVFGATNPKGHMVKSKGGMLTILRPKGKQINISSLPAYKLFREARQAGGISVSQNSIMTMEPPPEYWKRKQAQKVLRFITLDELSALSVNTTLSGPLLSRFDIVLVLLDTKNKSWDSIVSSHILADKTEEKQELRDDSDNMWSLPNLRRYIHYVKQHFRPVLTKKSKDIISSYYQLQRGSAANNAARTTVRMLESLIRLAQAHARLMFRNEVTQMDAIAAILCVESSMTNSAIVDNVGNALHSNFADNPDQEYAKQEKVILEKLGL